MLVLSTLSPATPCGPPAAGFEMKQIIATSDHIIARAVPRIFVLPFQSQWFLDPGKPAQAVLGFI
jgi:hypothetical protein